MAQRRTRRNETADMSADYWRESARPLTSLVFVAPMLVLYESGVLLLRQQAARNGADAWLRGWLDHLGFGQYFLLPSLTCALLLAWHHTRREAWRLRWPVLTGMACESAGFALALLLFARWQHHLFHDVLRPFWCAASPVSSDTLVRLVAYFGAGIYEELLFRLALLPAGFLLLQRLGFRRRDSWLLAIIATSTLFSLVHYRLDFYIGPCHIWLPYGDEFAWSSFTFRFLAGGFFATLFAVRGFGIAVGSHALYDIFASLL